ncbi:hypothetical protein [Ktedonobacter racemifer]|uniref:Uncharacterized protein n=1 Tax=Ktedonobacter racemifer DSM 44963 TaxID=485913 RepID=D6TDD0_KTERA|nr:hypothetical protein [Ktedonobacter racemifer]EFH88275.1 hypothetical protein Krac_9698 [Ktedonobacter racemifer DSM 44963]
MGILTDFFIATTEDVNTLRPEQLLRDLFPTLEMKNVDSSKVEILAKLVVGNSQEHMPNEKQPDFLVLVKGASEGEFRSPDECNEEDLMSFVLVIERFDSVFVECLAIFPAKQVLPVATQWARQWAEFDGRAVGKDDAESLSALLQQLCQFAKRALAEGKQLYLRTSGM